MLGRFLIVIDDVWETQSWGIIKLALVENNNRSRVIITTRTHEVASEAGEVYKLQPLSMRTLGSYSLQGYLVVRAKFLILNQMMRCWLLLDHTVHGSSGVLSPFT